MSNEQYSLNKGLAQMLKGGVIMDVTTPEQARIAEKAGACAVMALERIPADIRAKLDESKLDKVRGQYYAALKFDDDSYYFADDFEFEDVEKYVFDADTKTIYVIVTPFDAQAVLSEIIGFISSFSSGWSELFRGILTIIINK